MNFNDELQKLRKVKKYCFLEADRSIYKRYQELNKQNRIIDEYCRFIESHSYFDVKNIGNAIASLIRTFEGANYIYQEAEYHTTEVGTLAFDKHETKVTKHIKIVVSEDSRHNWYSDDRSENLNSIVRNGLAIILTCDTTEIEMPFYRTNTNNHTLEQCVKFGRFSYVKDFIDELISYKIEHNLKNIPADEIERLKIDFISSRVEQIEENYRLVTQHQEEQMKQKLDADNEHRQLLLKRILDKKEK